MAGSNFAEGVNVIESARLRLYGGWDCLLEIKLT